MSFHQSVLLVLSALALSIPAHAESELDAQKVLKELQNVAFRCTVQPYKLDSRGEKILGELKSVCSELDVNRVEARVETRTGRYRAVLLESDLADGGDLNHLLILNSDGEFVAQRTNVLAFGSLYLALSGGVDHFRQIEE